MSAEGQLPPWPDLIAEMGLLRQRLSEVKPLYPFTIPHVAATEEQLASAEARLGHALDPVHRAFLSYGNGWPDFYIDSDLLGTEDLGQGPIWERLQNDLDAFYASLEGPYHNVPPRDQIYPISFNPEEPSIFAIWTNGPASGNGGHPVAWLPWADTDPYDDFFEFFAVTYQDYEEKLTSAP